MNTLAMIAGTSLRMTQKSLEECLKDIIGTIALDHLTIGKSRVCCILAGCEDGSREDIHMTNGKIIIENLDSVLTELNIAYRTLVGNMRCSAISCSKDGHVLTLSSHLFGVPIPNVISVVIKGIRTTTVKKFVKKSSSRSRSIQRRRHTPPPPPPEPDAMISDHFRQPGAHTQNDFTQTQSEIIDMNHPFDSKEAVIVATRRANRFIRNIASSRRMTAIFMMAVHPMVRNVTWFDGMMVFNGVRSDHEFFDGIEEFGFVIEQKRLLGSDVICVKHKDITDPHDLDSVMRVYIKS